MAPSPRQIWDKIYCVTRWDCVGVTWGAVWVVCGGLHEGCFGIGGCGHWRELRPAHLRELMRHLVLGRISAYIHTYNRKYIRISAYMYSFISLYIRIPEYRYTYIYVYAVDTLGRPPSRPSPWTPQEPVVRAWVSYDLLYYSRYRF